MKLILMIIQIEFDYRNCGDQISLQLFTSEDNTEVASNHSVITNLNIILMKLNQDIKTAFIS